MWAVPCSSCIDVVCSWWSMTEVCTGVDDQFGDVFALSRRGKILLWLFQVGYVHITCTVIEMKWSMCFLGLLGEQRCMFDVIW